MHEKTEIMLNTFSSVCLSATRWQSRRNLSPDFMFLQLQHENFALDLIFNGVVDDSSQDKYRSQKFRLYRFITKTSKTFYSEVKRRRFSSPPRFNRRRLRKKMKILFSIVFSIRANFSLSREKHFAVSIRHIPPADLNKLLRLSITRVTVRNSRSRWPIATTKVRDHAWKCVKKNHPNLVYSSSFVYWHFQQSFFKCDNRDMKIHPIRRECCDQQQNTIFSPSRSDWKLRRCRSSPPHK